MPVERDVKRVVFCTGKVYYELDAEREAMGAEADVKIVRIEQLSPFPWTSSSASSVGIPTPSRCGARKSP